MGRFAPGYGPFLPFAWAVLVHGPFWYRPSPSTDPNTFQETFKNIFIRRVFTTVFNCNVCCSSFFVSGHKTFDDADADDDDDDDDVVS